MKVKTKRKHRSLYAISAVALCCILAIGAKVMHGRTSSIHKQLETQARNAHIDFDVSMQTNAHAALLQSYTHYIQELDFFRSLYNRNSLKQIKVDHDCKIPKIIHHIWLGSPLREKDLSFYESWRTHNADWTFVFWTDHAANYDKGDIVVHSFEELAQTLHNNKNNPVHIVVDTRNLDFANRVYSDQSPNYGERSDILRYEAVYRFGGVYVDCDFECYKELTLLHHMYDFYTGLQPLDTNRVQLGCALFGAIPGHPILRNCVENIKHNRHFPQIITRTGPIFFSREFYKTAGKTDLKDIAFPASYFYPRGYEERFKPKSLWCKTEAFATHHWAGSWLEPDGFVTKQIT